MSFDGTSNLDGDDWIDVDDLELLTLTEGEEKTLKAELEQAILEIKIFLLLIFSRVFGRRDSQ